MAASVEYDEAANYKAALDMVVILDALKVGLNLPDPSTFARLAEEYKNIPKGVVQQIVDEISRGDRTTIDHYNRIYVTGQQAYRIALDKMVVRYTAAYGRLGRGGADDWLKFKGLNDPGDQVPAFLINKIVKEGRQFRYSSTLNFYSNFYQKDPLDDGVDLKFDPDDPQIIDLSPEEIAKLKQELLKYGRPHEREYRNTLHELDNNYITLKRYDYITQIKRRKQDD